MGRHPGLGQLVQEPSGIELIQGLGCRRVVELGDVAPALERFQRVGDLARHDAGQLARHFAGPELQRKALLGSDQGVHHGQVQVRLVGDGVGENLEAWVGAKGWLGHLPLLYRMGVTVTRTPWDCAPKSARLGLPAQPLGRAASVVDPERSEGIARPDEHTSARVGVDRSETPALIEGSGTIVDRVQRNQAAGHCTYGPTAETWPFFLVALNQSADSPPTR